MTATMADMTVEFLEAILPTAKEGYLTGAVGHGGHFNGSGKYEFDRFEPFAFHWPTQAGEAVDHIQTHAPGCDVYTCPYLQKTPERKKGNAAWRQIVHSDCDNGIDQYRVHNVNGFAIWSGSPGHAQVYVRLTHCVTPDQHGALCRGLTAYLGGDRGKVSDNDLLRPAGCYNRKSAARGGTPMFVVAAGSLETAPIDPFELAKILDIDINAPVVVNGQTPVVDTNVRETVDLVRYRPVGEELFIDSSNRSKDTYRIICMCVDVGLNLAQTRWVIDQRTDLAERVAEFLHRHPPVDDVAESWTKVRSEWQRSHQMPRDGLQIDAEAAAPGPGRFFGKQGLRALDLANEVMDTVGCGFGQLDQRFYTYSDGVWGAGNNPIEAGIIDLLGNRYRSTYTKTVLDIIKYSPGIAHIVDSPLTDFINVPNGMVRWDTGELLPHNPAYGSTVQMPVEYLPNATCPRFEKFLREVLPPDLVDSGFIWELIGYTLYSGNPLHVAVLLFGKGRNGKGTLIRVLKSLLGEHNISSVSLHELTENKFRVATLYQKLANLAGDLDSKWLENTALFKKITGHDGIQGEYKYGASFEFDPWALPFYSANKAFGSPDSSEGWVARWVVVPFPNSFLGREDRLLDAKLSSESELRGILAKGIAALPALMARGNFADLPSLSEAKTDFVIASDAVRAWLDECCVIEPESWTPRTDLYHAYRWHTSSDGGKQLGAREFYNRVEQVQGIITTIRRGTRGMSGVRVKAVKP